MTTKLPSLKLCPDRMNLRWKTIKLADKQFFEIGIKPPTYAEQIENLETSDDGYTHRRFELIEDWRGVEDEDGNPVPYTIENFQYMCETFSTVLIQAANSVGHMFHISLPEDESKNSQATSSESSEEAKE